MHVIRTDGNLLQYNDVADQFVVVWLGIVAAMVDVKHYKTQRSWGQSESSISSNNMHDELGKTA